jgi:hypothetical protein
MMDFDPYYQVIENGVLKMIDSRTGEIIQEEIIDDEPRD